MLTLLLCEITLSFLVLFPILPYGFFLKTYITCTWISASSLALRDLYLRQQGGLVSALLRKYRSRTATVIEGHGRRFHRGSSIFLNFYCYSITVVCLSSPSLHPTPAKPTSLPHLNLPSWFCPCVLYSSSCKPLSSLSPPHSPLAIVRLFLTSMSLIIFRLLFSSVDYVPVKGDIIWYLSLTTWLISLSIMLSSSIHAVAKGISSFFLSAA